MTSYEGNVLADSPAIYYKLGEPPGSATAVTEVGLADGQYFGSPDYEQTGIPGAVDEAAVRFNGTPDLLYSAVPSQFGGPDVWPTGAQGFTIELWYAGLAAGVTDACTTSQMILASCMGLPGAGRWSLTIDTAGKVRVWVGSTGNVTVPVCVSSMDVTDGDYHHIVCTMAASTYATRLWIDRNLDDTGTGHGGGGDPVFVAATGDMTIDEVAMYLHVLADARIQAHYDAGVLPPPTPPAFTSAVSNLTVTGVAAAGPGVHFPVGSRCSPSTLIPIGDVND